jgi:anthranilate phosphoribosyltransferase
MNPSLREAIRRLSVKESLDSELASAALQQIIAGESSESETAAFLFGMRIKGETIEELRAFTQVMRAAMVKVEVDVHRAVDVCGTGGDQTGTVNISTAVMFVTAGAGVPVLKHGNRSVSSLSGSVDVLEQLGAQPLLAKPEAEACFKATGMSFMFAPYFHPAMKHVVGVRKALGVRTFFNLLGPLLNPAGVKRQVIGTFSAEAASTMATILSHFGMESVVTLHSKDGLDELSVSAGNHLFHLDAQQRVHATEWEVHALGIEPSPLSDLIGGDATYNAAVIRALFEGKSTRGLRDTVLVNAALAIQTAGAAGDMSTAFALATESLDSGKAMACLNTFVTCTQDLTTSNASGL